MTRCPLCGEHDVEVKMFGQLYVAPCPEVPLHSMRVLLGVDGIRGPLVLEPG